MSRRLGPLRALLFAALVGMAGVVAAGETTYADHGDGTVTVVGGVSGMTVTVEGSKALADAMIQALAAAASRQDEVPCRAGASLRDADRVLVVAGSEEYGCTDGEVIPNPQPVHDSAMIGLKLTVEELVERYLREVEDRAAAAPDFDLDAP